MEVEDRSEVSRTDVATGILFDMRRFFSSLLLLSEFCPSPGRRWVLRCGILLTIEILSAHLHSLCYLIKDHCRIVLEANVCPNRANRVDIGGVFLCFVVVVVHRRSFWLTLSGGEESSFCSLPIAPEI